MDLFSLVARLTLDEKDYEKALKQAERKAGSAKVDVSGEIRVADHFSDALHRVESAAQNFDGDVSGEITADDQYTGKVEAAEGKADEADLDADGELSADDQYSGDLISAEGNAANAELDADGELTATDNYSGTLEAVVGAATDANLNADGVLSADNQYTEALEDAEADASTADLDADGELTADDQYSGDLANAVTAAADAFLDAEGTLSAVDDYTEALEGAENDAAVADLDADGTLTADDDYTEVLEGAENDAAVADLDAEGVITLDTSDFTTELGNAEEAASGFSEQFTSLISGIEDKLKKAGIVAAVGSIATSLHNAIQGTAGYADTIDKQSQALSISRGEYQKWDHALRQSGASMATVTRGFKNLNSFLGGEATDDISAAMDALNINPADYKGTEDLFEAVIGSLSELEEGSERDNLVTAIFGRGGTQLNALLNSGKKGIEDLRQEAEDLGLIMSDEDIANGVAFGDAFANMQAATEALRNKVVSELFPILTDAVNLVTQLMSGEADPEAFNAAFNNILGKVPVLVQKFISALTTAIPQIVGMLSTLFKDQGFYHSLFDLVLAIVKGVKDMLASLAAGALEAGYDAVWGEGEFRKAGGLRDTLDPEHKVWEDPTTPKPGSTVEDMENRSSAAYQLTQGRGGGNAHSIYITGAEVVMPESAAPYVPKDATYVASASLREKGAFVLSDGTIVVPDGYGLWDRIYKANGDTDTLPAGTFAYDESDVLWRNSSNLELPAGASAYIPEGAIYADGADLTANGAQITAFGTILIPDGGGGQTVYYPDGSTGHYSGQMPDDLVVWQNGSHAKGLWDVPYDNYLAALHRDEMVLTASQARDYREGNSDSDTMMDLIQLLRTDMANLKIQVGEKVFGQTVVDYSGRKMRGYIGRAEDRVISGYGWG